MQAFIGIIQRLATIALIAGCLCILTVLPAFCAPATAADATTVTATIDDWARVTIIPPPDPLTSGELATATVNAEANFKYNLYAYWQSTHLATGTSAMILATNLLGPHDAGNYTSLPIKIIMTLLEDGGTGSVYPTTGTSEPFDTDSATVGIDTNNYGTIAVQISKAP